MRGLYANMSNHLTGAPPAIPYTLPPLKAWVLASTVARAKTKIRKWQEFSFYTVRVVTWAFRVNAVATSRLPRSRR